MMRILRNIILAAALAFFVIDASTPAGAGIGSLTDKLKKKAKEKAEEKVEKTLEGSPEDTTEAEEEAAEVAQPGETGGGTAASEDMTLYTKYDFIPGDRVIFYDDLSGEEIGEFPSRWKLVQGVFEIVKQGGRKYIMCTDTGYIIPKMASGPLPPKYTLEMELYSNGPKHDGHWFYIQWLDAEDRIIAEFAFKDSRQTSLTVLDKTLASKSLASKVPAGIHTMRIMATTSTIKCYLDNVRVANVPKVEGFEPVLFRVRMDPWENQPGNPMLLASFRFAEGGKTLKEQLDETGRIITHGILFDSGSDRIKAESYKTLAGIGELLTENPGLRLSIEGHTDSEGAEDYNMDLSERRAVSVRTYLMDTYKVDGNRLESRGWGETKPLDTNNTPEGMANNRRVELVKI
jgi:OOP family OmpA-OmpF porin